MRSPKPTNLIRFTALLTVLLIAVTVHAQTPVRNDIELHVINPTGFLASGSSEVIYLELVNPPGSGVTIDGVPGGGGSMSIRPTPLVTISPTAPFNVYSAVFADLPSCGPGGYCIISDSFPVQPGESMTLGYKQLNAIEELGSDRELGLNLIRLTLTIDGDSWRVYSRNQVLYIITEDGSGDSAIFANYKIDLAPVVIPELQVQLEAPVTLLAGEHFNLRARITNPNAYDIPYIASQFGGFAPSFEADQFKYVPCYSGCVLGGSASLSPGESVTLDLGNFYYEADTLDHDLVAINSWNFSVTDIEGRQIPVTSADEPIVIEIVGPADAPIENPARLIPPRAALEIRDLSAGDQLLLHDPNTGSDWLRLTASENVSYDELQWHLANNPAVTGFRLARLSQVEELLLNYLYHRNIFAATYDLHSSDTQVNDALHEFVQLIGDTASPLPSSMSITAGLIADKPPFNSSGSQQFTHLQLSANNPGGVFTTFPRGLRTQTSTEAMAPYLEGSYWLVRAINQPGWIPLGATYSRDELRISNLQVGDESFKVSMNFRYAATGVMQLTELQALENPLTETVAGFDMETGELLMPELAFCRPDGLQDQYRIRMTMIPDSDPALFVISESELLVASQQPAQSGPVTQNICQLVN